MKHSLIALSIISLAAFTLRAETPAPSYWKFAPTPPMGWNSYDAFGDSVTEEEILANARYQKEHLLPHGWTYVVVDYRWYDPGAHNNNPNGRAARSWPRTASAACCPPPIVFPRRLAARVSSRWPISSTRWG